MAVEGITSTSDIFIPVDDDGVPFITETPGGRGQIPSAEVTYLCPWDVRMAVYQDLLGGFTLVNGLGVPTPGHAYPPSPNIFCDTIGQVRGKGIAKEFLRENAGDAAARRWGWSKWCLIPVTYRPIDYAYDFASADRSVQLDPAEPIFGCRQRTEVNNTYIVLDNAKMELLKPRPTADSPFAWRDTREVLQNTEGIPANTVSFTLEYPRVPRDPWLFLEPFIGRVNLFRMWGLDPGHILFASLSTDVTPTFSGPTISAALTFIGNKDVAWNETLDDAGLVAPKVFVNNDGTDFRFPFKSADLMLPLRS